MIRLYLLCFFQVATFNVWQLFPEANQWQVYDISLRVIIASGVLFAAIKPCYYGVMALVIHSIFLLKDIAEAAAYADVHNPVPELIMYCIAMAIPAYMKIRGKRKGCP